MKIAIIGTGISGLASAYYLTKQFGKELEICMYEKESYIGGHSYTYELPNKEKIDIGFQVMNKKTYPNFLKLCEELNVKLEKTSMSFSVFDENFEWGTESIYAILYNLKNKKFRKLIMELLDFYKKAKKAIVELENMKDRYKLTLHEFCTTYNISENLKQYYLIPFCSSVWSVSYKDSENISIYNILVFMQNHQLLQLNSVQWYILKNKSQEYIKKIVEYCANNLKKFTIIKNITVNVIYTNKNVYIESNNLKKDMYSYVIIATNSDVPKKIIKNMTIDQKKILNSFKTTTSNVVVHTDTQFMPSKKINWSSWNYYLDKETNVPILTYWMKSLQHVEDTNLFVTLNPPSNINKTKILHQKQFSHPNPDTQSQYAKDNINIIQGINNIYYAGAYLYNCFHEDGVNSALNVVNLIKKNK